MVLRSTVYGVVGSIIALVATPSVAEASCIPGFDFAAFSNNPLVIGGGAVTNSYDSSLGTYASTVTNSGGDICTNSTGADAVKFNGSGTQVYGNVCVGTGGTVPSNINAAPGQYLSSSVLSTPIVLTPVTVPTVGTNQGNLNCNGCTIPPNQTYGNVTMSNTATLNAGTYVFNTLDVGNTATLFVNTGPVVIYISAASGAVVDVKGLISNPGLKATDLTIMVAATSSCTVKVNGGATAAYSLYSPGCDITVNGSGTIYGAIVGKDVKITGSAAIHYDAALKNHGFGAFACVPKEVSRASPIISSIGGFETIVQGTYDYPLPTPTTITTPASVTAFRFPHSQGHLRISKTSQFAGTAVDFAGRVTNEIVNVKGGAADTFLPPLNMSCTTPFTSACRTVFTNPATGINPGRTVFNTTNQATIGAAIVSGLAGTWTATEYATIVSRIISGDEVSTGTFKPRLGGLDRSTVAVIPKSLVAGTARPKMIYVGGTDGMLHAFCADTVAPCDAIGRELWAFVPRTQLQQLRTNSAIIDGSPRVVDMYGDFNNDTVKGFSTMLMFTTGTGDRTANRTPAVYALDVTDPGNPIVSWEYTMATPSSPGAFELGQGQMLTAGPVLVAGSQKNAVFIQTNNGAAMKDSSGTVGSGAEGTIVTALDVETMTPLWTPFTFAYPDPVRVATNGDVPYQAVPGGVVAVDLTGSGTFTDLVFGTIFGDIWVLDAKTGANQYGTGPLFRLTNDFEPVGVPPSVFSDGGSLYAVAGTGAYWDRSSATAWSASATQHVFAVKIKTTATTPLDEFDATSGDVPFAIALTGGQKVSSQILVVGEQIAFLTDTTNINDSTYGTGAATGAAHLYGFDGASAGNDTLVVAGVGALAASGTNLYASAGKGTERLGFNAAGTAGEVVNGAMGPKVSRRLWLRTL